jgi:large subunit ribosomal protein L25
VELSGSMKLVSDPQTVIAHCVAMRAEEVVAPVEGAVPVAEAAVPAAAEPEVAKKGKKEEEAGEKEKGKKK